VCPQRPEKIGLQTLAADSRKQSVSLETPGEAAPNGKIGIQLENTAACVINSI
jgi:hypothetical protein